MTKTSPTKSCDVVINPLMSQVLDPNLVNVSSLSQKI